MNGDKSVINYIIFDIIIYFYKRKCYVNFFSMPKYNSNSMQVNIFRCSNQLIKGSHMNVSIMYLSYPKFYSESFSYASA